MIGLLAASVVSTAVSGAFGGGWERLPQDAQDRLEARLEAAFGDSLEGLSDDAATERVTVILEAGLPRLDDDTLIERYRLFVSAIDAVDDGPCAAGARQLILDGRLDPEIGTKVIEALDTASLSRWMEISVEGIEAEVRGSPAGRSVPDSSADALLDRILADMAPADLETIFSMSSGATVGNPQACSLFRALYHAGDGLKGTDLADFALMDDTP